MKNSEQAPHILIIMADQMTPFMLGAYGHPLAQTPNIDALAQRGTRFNAAYSPIPICVPARAPLDGCSLLPLLQGQPGADRPVFCEYHAEGVMNPSVMVRLGQYKYHYFHNQPPQLFDLQTDPHEWHNLAGQPDYAEIERGLKTAVSDNFDLDNIIPTMLARLQQKKIVRQAMHRNHTSWDYQPHFDATQQYMRTSADDPYMRK